MPQEREEIRDGGANPEAAGYVRYLHIVRRFHQVNPELSAAECYDRMRIVLGRNLAFPRPRGRRGLPRVAEPPAELEDIDEEDEDDGQGRRPVQQPDAGAPPRRQPHRHQRPPAAQEGQDPRRRRRRDVEDVGAGGQEPQRLCCEDQEEGDELFELDLDALISDLENMNDALE